MSLSKAVEIIIGVCVISAVITVQVMIVKHERAVVPQAEYKRGDCITPTDTTYSWFGQYAEVQAFTVAEGFREPIYVLSFPNWVSNSAMFGKDIERFTTKVAEDNCHN